MLHRVFAFMSSSAPSATPVLSAVEFDAYDSTGGDNVLLTGSALGDMTATVTIDPGGPEETTATLVSNDGSDLVFTMPVIADGFYDVIVTTAGGDSNALEIEAWSPKAVGSCRSWHRADLGVTTAGGVSFDVTTWADQSGAGDSNRNATQATGAARPELIPTNADFNGRATLHFDGDDHLRTGVFAGSPYAQPTTIYAVYRTDIASGYGYIYDGLAAGDGVGGPGRQALYGHNAAGFFHAGGGTPALLSPNATALVSCVVFDYTSSEGFIDDPATPAGSGNPWIDAFEGLTIGLRFSLSSDWFFGDIAEIITYSGHHDEDTRTKVMGMLARRYGT